eukprot:CAMPEP_0184299148 /NCGR_PEP_ID=MMETSP1049-20130417/9810_1 /TAXON_ID=77928 /ORGANISM="Proteomonas sulcata, Strain CCMP704" /LENGTH=259 /DNA_ID=CAMNT_0026609495 /DNA_START=94 /DNA_END=873 /DNA_ORIENTATION=+
MDLMLSQDSAALLNPSEGGVCFLDSLVFQGKAELATSLASRYLGAGWEARVDESEVRVKGWIEASEESPFVLYRGTLFGFRIDPQECSLEMVRFKTLLCGHACLKGQRGYLELEIVKLGKDPQIGFATPNLKRIKGKATKGVGDLEGSWGVDGVRGRRWHPSAPQALSAYPFKWKKGDFLCLASDLVDMRMLVAVNGDFSDPQTLIFEFGEEVDALFPAISASNSTFKYNLGASGFKFNPPGAEFQPFAALRCCPNFKP